MNLAYGLAIVESYASVHWAHASIAEFLTTSMSASSMNAGSTTASSANMPSS